ncbi:zinc metalloprotease [Meredithblackwellia eburnea MCA 4105]
MKYASSTAQTITPSATDVSSSSPPTPASKLQQVTATHDIPETFHNFHLMYNLKPTYTDIRLVKWKSQVTGLSVVWADVPGPLVQGQFVIPTETWDDTGSPHALEHLVFCGSERYPYKGILDTLANKLFADGTNATTHQTHTAFTLSCAGADGFLRLLPVYLDHLLYPTITPEALKTEIYHLNGDGQEGGVMYCEMKGRSDGMSDLMERELQRTLFKERNAMRYETAGLPFEIRQLTVEKIREFHSANYVPQNLTLIILGRSLPPTQLLSTLARVEQSIPFNSNSSPTFQPPPFPRPFIATLTSSNPPVLTSSLIREVPFPAEDESEGCVMLRYIGYNANDWLTMLALSILGNYLAGTSESPMMREMVEGEDWVCTDITFHSTTQDPAILTIYLTGVPTHHLSSIGTTFCDFLHRLSKMKGDVFDMDRMKDIVERARHELYEVVESDPAGLLSDAIVSDILFGAEDGSDLEAQLSEDDFDVLENWSADDWMLLLKRYFIEKPSVTIIGRPSSTLASELADADSQRLAAEVEKLGPDGLLARAETMRKAEDASRRSAPLDLLQRFPVPDEGKLDWFEVEAARSIRPGEGSLKRIESQETERENLGRLNRLEKVIIDEDVELPWFIQFHQIPSHFIDISIYLFPASAPSVDLSVLPLYLKTFFHLPVGKDDIETVSRRLEKEFISYSIDKNLPMQEGLTLQIKVRKEKYGSAVSFLGDLLHSSVFVTQRLTKAVKKAIQNVTSLKCDGDAVSYAGYRNMVDDEKSVYGKMNLLRLLDTLPELESRLETDPAVIVRALESLRKDVLNPNSMRIEVTGDIAHLDGPVKTWKDNFVTPVVRPTASLNPIVLGSHAQGPLGTKPEKTLVLFGIHSLPSSHGYIGGLGPDSWTHPDQAPLAVAKVILNSMEGLIWKGLYCTSVRGAGLGYNATINQDTESGILYCEFGDTPDCVRLFEVLKSLMRDVVTGQIVIDEHMLESAKSSLVFGAADSESSLHEAASEYFTRTVLHNLSASHAKNGLAQAQMISSEQVVRAVQRWIEPLFYPKTSIASIAVRRSDMDNIAEAFKAHGYEVEKRLLVTDGEETNVNSDGEESEDEGSEESDTEQ